MPPATLAHDGHSWPRRALWLVVALIVVLAMGPLPAVAQEVPELQITSTNYILVDADTGEIYAQRGAHDRRAPASLTKIFTAIEVIEEARPGEAITTSEADMVSEFASQVGFGPGETFRVEDLLYGMMLPSGNDAARALARGLGAEPGDSDEQAQQRFLDRLNQRLRDMGLTDTHLVNPDGWGVPDHYSSAYDLAAFTMYALHYPRFVRAFSTGSYETADGQYAFKNNNRMLTSYEGIVGGKTGYDMDAGWCLVNVAERDGHRMIAVTLNGVAPDDWYDDSRVLLDYGFEQKALRAASDAGVSGEIVRYRDPDAALIQAMGSAGATVSEPKVGGGTTVETTSDALTQIKAESAGEMPPIAGSVPELVPVPAAPPGASGVGLIAAVSVATLLILLQGVSAWRHAGNPGAVRQRPEPAVAASD